GAAQAGGRGVEVAEEDRERLARRHGCAQAVLHGLLLDAQEGRQGIAVTDSTAEMEVALAALDLDLEHTATVGTGDAGHLGTRAVGRQRRGGRKQPPPAPVRPPRRAPPPRRGPRAARPPATPPAP